jgi:hypothetical protein
LPKMFEETEAPQGRKPDCDGLAWVLWPFR